MEPQTRKARKGFVNEKWKMKNEKWNHRGHPQGRQRKDLRMTNVGENSNTKKSKEGD